MTKLNNKETYVRIILLKDDISLYHKELNDNNDWSRKMRLFKNCFGALDILRDSFSHFNLLIKGKHQLIEKARSLKRRLEFINHLRNKISGHLDEQVIAKAVQWEPSIFSQDIKDNDEAKRFLIYKSLIESSINSYREIDTETNVSGPKVDTKKIEFYTKQKVFDTEIDLIYPPDQKLFFDYVGNLNCDAIEFLTEIEYIVKEKVVFWNKDELVEMTKVAAETDFNLKK